MWFTSPYHLERENENENNIVLRCANVKGEEIWEKIKSYSFCMVDYVIQSNFAADQLVLHLVYME